MKKLIFVLLSLCLLFGYSNFAYACSCKQPAPPKEALKKSSAVFIGIATAKKDNGVSYTVSFDIIEIVKGAKKPSTTVSTNRDEASCGYNFLLNETYLVYAYGEPGHLETNICTRTASLADAEEDVKALNIKLIKEEDKKRPAKDQASDDEISRYAFIILILAAISYYLFKKMGR